MSAYPDIPWNAIYGMRNFISHEYANIDEDIIVSAINDDLSPLKAAIENLLENYYFEYDNYIRSTSGRIASPTIF